MGFSSLTLYCTPEELTGWLVAAAQRYELAALVFRETRVHAVDSDRTWRIRPGVVVAGDAISIDADVFSIFLLPAGDAPSDPIVWRDLGPRGWLEARPGHAVRHQGELEGDREDILLETVLSAPTTSRSSAKPARWLGWLKRRVKADGAVAGVGARNIKFGGEGRYDSIRYSPGALRLYRSGTVWKQFLDGNVVFYPPPADADDAIDRS